MLKQRPYRAMLITVTLLILLWSLWPAGAQDGGPSVTVSVEASREEAVINESQLTVSINLEGDATQCPIIETNRPVDAVLVMDSSGSMEGEYMDNAKRAANVFVDTMTLGVVPDAGGDQVGLVSFSSRARELVPLTQDINALRAEINNLGDGGGTEIDDGIKQGLDTVTAWQTQNPAANRVLILLSDGNSDLDDALRAADQAKAAGVRIVAIGLGPGIDRAALEQIASSPSDFRDVQDPTQLSLVFSEIAQTIQPTTAARNVTLNYQINTANFQFVPGTIRPNSGVEAGGLISWTLGELEGGTTKTFSFDVLPTQFGAIDVGAVVNSGYLFCESEEPRELIASGPLVQVVPPSPTPTNTPTATPTNTPTPTHTPMPTEVAIFTDPITPDTNRPTSLTLGLSMCAPAFARWFPIILAIVLGLLALAWIIWNFTRWRERETSNDLNRGISFMCFLARSALGTYAAFALWVLLMPPAVGFCPQNESVYFFRQETQGGGLAGVYMTAPESQGVMPFADLNEGSCIGCHAVSDSGQQIASIVGVPPNRISVTDVHNNPIAVEALNNIDAVYSDFSPDGTQLVVADASGDLQIVNLQTGAIAPLQGASEPNVFETMPSWGPNGRIAFVRSDNPVAGLFDGVVINVPIDIYHVSATGGAAEPLQGASGDGAFNYYPSYSPDGQWLTFTKHNNTTTYRDPQSEIFMLTANGGGATRLALNDSTNGNSWANWSGDSSRIAYSAYTVDPSDPNIYYADIGNGQSGESIAFAGAAERGVFELHPIWGQPAQRVDWLAQLIALLFPFLFPIVPLAMLAWAACQPVVVPVEEKVEPLPPANLKPPAPPKPLEVPPVPPVWQPQPTLVIGLGLSGRWVLTHLKKSLLDAKLGEMPEGIRLMAIDTGNRVMYEDESSAIHFAGVELDDSEVIEITDNLSDILNDESYMRDPQFRRWWNPAQIRGLGSQRLDLQRGADNQRVLGRAGFLYHLRKHEDNIFTRMKAYAPECVDKNGRLNVLIVGDTAGDVSSAVLYDVAALMRGIAKQVGVNSNISVTAHVITDAVFRSGTVNRERDLSNTGAFLREMRRFQLAEARPFPIYYNEIDDERMDALPVDDIVLYDGGQLSDMEDGAKLGVYPAVADAIAQMMDLAARRGAVGTLLNRQSAALSDRVRQNYEVYISTQNTFSYRLPFADLLAVVRTRFEEDLLRRLFVGPAEADWDAATQPSMNKDKFANEHTPLAFAQGFYTGDFQIQANPPLSDNDRRLLRGLINGDDEETVQGLEGFSDERDLIKPLVGRLQTAMLLLLNGSPQAIQTNMFMARGGKLGFTGQFLNELEKQTQRLIEAVDRLTEDEISDDDQMALKQMLDTFADKLKAVKVQFGKQLVALGVTSGMERESVKALVLGEQRDSQQYRQEMNQIMTRRYIWTESEDEGADTLDVIWYNRYLRDKREEAFGQFFWDVDGDGVTLTLRVRTKDEPNKPPVKLDSADPTAFKQALTDLATNYCIVIRNKETLDKLLEPTYLSEIHDRIFETADALREYTVPLLDFDEEGAGNYEHNVIISANETIPDGKRGIIRDQISARYNNPDTFIEMNATNPFSLALIQRSSLIPLSAVRSLQAAQAYYLVNYNLSNDPTQPAPRSPILTSVYEAESAAIELEQQSVSLLRLGKEELHPIVITALTESRRVELFCLALASGDIDIEELPGNNPQTRNYLYRVNFILPNGNEQAIEPAAVLKDTSMHPLVNSLLAFVNDKQNFRDSFIDSRLQAYTNNRAEYQALWREWVDEQWNDWMEIIPDDDEQNGDVVSDILKVSRIYALTYMR